MREKIVNGIISAMAGAAAALASLWLMNESADPKKPAESAASPAASPSIPGKIEELEVARLKVTDGIMVYHSKTGEPLIELKDGVVLAKREILSRFVGGMEMVGQKLQITTGDPSASDPPIFCELGAGDGGQGAYIALLSPKGTHSLNIGFDKNETGFVVSRNNDDAAMTAQVVLPLPKKGEPKKEPAPQEAELQDDELTLSENQAVQISEPKQELKPDRLALGEGESKPQKTPGGLPMLSPAKLR